jgi:hypothetical protein
MPSVTEQMALPGSRTNPDRIAARFDVRNKTGRFTKRTPAT